MWSLVVTETQVFHSKKLSLQSGQKVAPETGRREEKNGKREGREERREECIYSAALRLKNMVRLTSTTEREVYSHQNCPC